MINNINIKGSYQICELQGHDSRKIVGYCLRKSCFKQSFYCSKCLRKLHSSHDIDCKTFQEIQQILQNKIESFQNSLRNLYDIEKNIKQQIEFLNQEFVKEIQIIQELSQHFTNLNYNQMLQKISQIKYIYKEKTILNQLEEGYLENFQQFSQKFDQDKQQYLLLLDQKQKQKIIFISDDESDYSSNSNDDDEKNSLKSVEFQEENQEAQQQIINIPDIYEQQQSLSQEDNEIGQNENENQKVEDNSQNFQIQKFQMIIMNEDGDGLQRIQKSNKLFEEAMRLTKSGNLNEAIKIYDEIYNLEILKVQALLNKGLILRRQQKFDQAYICFEEITQLDPNNEQAYSLKGNILFNLLQFEKSIECYDKILLMNPNSAKAHSNKAACLKQLNKLEEAISHCKISVELDKFCGFAQNLLGQLLLRKGEYNQSIQHFENAYQLLPIDHEPIKNKCIALMKLQRNDEALSICDTVIKKDQNIIWVYKIKSKIYQNMQLFYDALDCCEIGLVLDPFDLELIEDKEQIQKILNEFQNII